MAVSTLPVSQLAPLSEFIAATMGLQFSRERWPDLQRALAAAAQEFGFADIETCANWLLATPLSRQQLEVLASHLTVGETFFFREKKTFEALATTVLPELVRARQNGERRLRLWSAACCTGEEAYSLAILLDQNIPALADWNVTILATDINARFLHKAAAGVYGEWSFRDVPAWVKDRYFERNRDGRYAIAPEIKRLVTFAHLNLVEDVYPTVVNDTNAMDLILCRNVLMYFTTPQARKVAARLHRALVEGGWLIVSPSEASHTLFAQFSTVNVPGAILYQKTDPKSATSPEWRSPQLAETSQWSAPLLERAWDRPLEKPGVVVPEPFPPLPRQAVIEPDTPPSPYAEADVFYQRGRYAEAAEALLAWLPTQPPQPEAFSLLARALANQGRLADALAWCERWVVADKLDAASHYLRAVILHELGDTEPARRALQRALYLEPKLVLAHFALGNLALNAGQRSEAEKHFRNALRLLAARAQGDVLPESDGLTAGRLTEIVTSMINAETSA